MAYTLFDAFGREPVAQTEEELAANAKPVTQTIKTNPVTGEQTMTVSGSPQDLSAANPLTPTVSPVAPVAPVVGGPMRQPVIESTALPAQTIFDLETVRPFPPRITELIKVPQYRPVLFQRL